MFVRYLVSLNRTLYTRLPPLSSHGGRLFVILRGLLAAASWRERMDTIVLLRLAKRFSGTQWWWWWWRRRRHLEIEIPAPPLPPPRTLRRPTATAITARQTTAPAFLQRLNLNPTHSPATPLPSQVPGKLVLDKRARACDNMGSRTTPYPAPPSPRPGRNTRSVAVGRL